MQLVSVGGYGEVGKNMTAVKIEDDVVLLDMGFYLPSLINFEEEGNDRKTLSDQDLIRIGAIPNDNILSSWKDKVRAIALSHCHLDHIGAAPYLAPKYKAPILGTPYTTEVLNRMMKDDRLSIKNELKSVNPNSSIKINDNIEIEMINMTHSTLQTAMMAVHTKKGTILYANDFKFDNYPVLGKKPNYKRLRELGQGNVIALVVDSLYADAERKTPSEKVAREMLKDVILGTENRGNAIIVTCFASHLARIKSIIDFGKKLDRKIVFLGRSLMKYSSSAERINLVDFSKHAEICGYGDKIKKKLKTLEKNRDKYVIVCTGGQGEPGAVLTRLASGDLPFRFQNEDHVIFSNKTIPADINIANRAKLEKDLKRKKARIFTDIHVSGHASREDLRDLVRMVNPQHIIPAHGEIQMLDAMGELSEEMGYKVGKNVHLMKDSNKVEI
jgi:ribonuclease J